MLTENDITILQKRGEGPDLEFKLSISSTESLAKLITGFANANGGTLLVGVLQTGVLASINVDRFTRLVEQAKSRIQGVLQLTAYTVNVRGITVGVVEVGKANMPVATSEGYFQRTGNKVIPFDATDLVARMSSLPDHGAVLSSLSATISGQSAEIARLRESFDRANSWQRKAFYAVLGAVAGVLAKALIASLGLVGG